MGPEGHRPPARNSGNQQVTEVTGPTYEQALGLTGNDCQGGRVFMVSPQCPDHGCPPMCSGLWGTQEKGSPRSEALTG
jgi:hypothetical protein